ncbi:MAG: lytic transglycosylase domain-containing protein [Treponema sp.]|jgi:soluble lytic murein transglycosylase|nr:lytic transglycosylase domain-containing protein [Treponema sp.]
MASCQSRDVLDIKAAQAVRFISKGDLDFILRAPPSRLGELLALHPGAAFYAGLLAEEKAAAFRAEAAGDPALSRPAIDAAANARIAETLYTVSLESHSPLVREAAAEKLIPLILKSGDEGAARRLLLKIRTGGRAGDGDPAAFFLTAQPDEFYRLRRAVTGESFTGAEADAVTGRIAVSRLSFAEALASFRKTLEQDETLFFQYPALLRDLGRTLEFTSAGTVLFQEWEEQLTAGTIRDAAPETRYLLPYFAGRMERRAERYAEAAEFFTRALAAAPDPVQEDACMWYILDIAQSANPDSLIPLLKTYMPRWHSVPYFEDILERQARYFAAKGQWDALFEVYSLFPEESGWAARGQYAYLLGRAVSLGLFTGDLPGKGSSSEQADGFFRAAREETAAPFYYRALASHFSGAAPLSFPENPAFPSTRGKTAKVPPASRTVPGPENFPHPDEMEFLLGFFRYGAAGHIAPYVQTLQEELTADELRVLAEAFYGAERWNEAIRIMRFCMSRKGYVLTRRDMELSFPRPFRELTETYAGKADIPAPLLYGLIRTESAFDPDAHSRAGATGLTQLMTATAQDMAARLARRGGPQYAENGEIDLKDPETNIHLGAVYLKYLMNNLKSPMTAVLAYNGGMGRVRRWRRAAENRLPEDLFMETLEISETRDYGRKVFGAAAVYGYLYYGISMEDTVSDIIK